MTHWLAPALSFTAEEAWLSYDLNEKKTSIHLELFPDIPENWNNEEVKSKWMIVQSVRKTITESIEVERSAKTIGSSLECEIYLYSSDLNKVKILETLDFSEIAIISKATIVNAQVPSNANLNDDAEIGVVVKKANGIKCDRCWKIDSEVCSVDSEFGVVHLCERCREAV